MPGKGFEYSQETAGFWREFSQYVMRLPQEQSWDRQNVFLLAGQGVGEGKGLAEYTERGTRRS